MREYNVNVVKRTEDQMIEKREVDVLSQQKHEVIVKEINNLKSIKEHLNDVICRVNNTPNGDISKSELLDNSIPLSEFLIHSSSVLREVNNEIHDMISELDKILF